jgi:hypothetical protein
MKRFRAVVAEGGRSRSNAKRLALSALSSKLVSSMLSTGVRQPSVDVGDAGSSLVHSDSGGKAKWT